MPRQCRLPGSAVALALVMSFLCLGVGPLSAAEGRYTHIYAFGDSLSDNGALLLLTEEAVKAEIPGAMALPDAADSRIYWQGRWSNGPTAVELLAAKMKVQLTDYAMGGAKSDYGNYYAWLDYYRDTGALGQVRAHLTGLKDGRADSGALYFLVISANDYFQWLDFHRTESPEQMGVWAADNTALAVDRLARAGALNIFVVHPVNAYL